MDFSDDDEEMLPQSVTNYYFVDEKEEPVCFSTLPFRWQDDQSPGACKAQVFLHGVGHDGLPKIFKQVTEWKVEFDGIRPEIYIFSKDGKWLQLLKPRKSYEAVIRKILITVRFLYFLKKNPDSSVEALWNHIKKVFSHFEVRASQFDLVDHAPFIREMAQRDESLNKSQLLPQILDEAFKKKNVGVENSLDTRDSDFINDNDDADEVNVNNDDDSDEEKDCFDSACAICDNGGDILCCEGPCFRSFHAIKGSGDDSYCDTLGYTSSQVKAIPHFKCKNCEFNQHQCYACGKLGSSDVKSSAAEVFNCGNATCGHFYHPHCVAKLLHPENELEATEEEKRILSGQKFVCPVHKCVVCKGIEDRTVHELQFAVCRRCPRSYHRKCLPRKIIFEEDAGPEDTPRAWENLLPQRILIYCLRHKIDDEIGTPARTHLIFPGVSDEKKVHSVSSGNANYSSKQMVKDLLQKRAATKSAKLAASKVLLVKENDSVKDKQVPSVRMKKKKTSDASEKQVVLSKFDKGSFMDEAKISGTGKPKVLLSKEIEPLRHLHRDTTGGKPDRIASPASVVKLGSSVPVIDRETEKRVMAVIHRSSLYSLTLEDFIKEKDVPSTHAYSARHVDKSITQVKVSGSIEAVQTALQKVDEDTGNTENAKVYCEPGILNQIMKWRNKLGVYLSPFLHGFLYTSFGRHFTKVDKLKEIVEKLHWYVRSGDMIVDFCCGANDFSILMKEKLEATGKECFYRNYDIIPPKNDFKFVMSDWMKVQRKDLPPGSKLIMGLNPPFGVKAALANKFIDKALEFKPKLLILIVPKETQRLDEKRGVAYDLIWEDDEKLSGKAFYLPGTVDANDKQLDQWNLQPPPLYLWSHPDWTSKHLDIAKKYGHIGSVSNESMNVGKKMQISSHNGEEKPEQVAMTEDAKTTPKENDTHASKSNTEPASARHKNMTKRKSDGMECVSIGDNGSQQNSKKRRKKAKRRDNSQAREVKESSDMSISPRPSGNKLDPIAPDALESPSSRADTSNASQRAVEYGMTYEKGQIHVPSSDGLDSRGSSYHRSLDVNTYPGGSLSSDNNMLDPVHGTRRLDEHVQGYGKLTDPDNYNPRRYGVPGRSSADDIHTDIRIYGQYDTYNFGAANSRLVQNTLPLPSSSFGFSDLGPHTSAMERYAPRLDVLNHGFSATALGSSAMDRYAPRLDVMNLVRRNASTPETSQVVGGGNYGAPASWPGVPSNPLGFAPGPQNSYQSQGTSGWLND